MKVATSASNTPDASTVVVTKPGNAIATRVGVAISATKTLTIAPIISLAKMALLATMTNLEHTLASARLDLGEPTVKSPIIPVLQIPAKTAVLVWILVTVTSCVSALLASPAPTVTYLAKVVLKSHV